MIVFGDAPAGETCERRGGWAVVVDERWRVAVVRSGAGLFLPGGLLEPGEAPEQAMRRGVRACGIEIEVLSPLGHAGDWGLPGSRELRIASFFLCRPLPPPAAGAGGAQWLRGSLALASLALPSDRWVTGRALGPC